MQVGADQTSRSAGLRSRGQSIRTDALRLYPDLLIVTAITAAILTIRDYRVALGEWMAQSMLVGSTTTRSSTISSSVCNRNGYKTATTIMRMSRLRYPSIAAVFTLVFGIAGLSACDKRPINATAALSAPGTPAPAFVLSGIVDPTRSARPIFRVRLWCSPSGRRTAPTKLRGSHRSTVWHGPTDHAVFGSSYWQTTPQAGCSTRFSRGRRGGAQSRTSVWPRVASRGCSTVREPRPRRRRIACSSCFPASCYSGPMAMSSVVHLGQRLAIFGRRSTPCWMLRP